MKTKSASSCLLAVLLVGLNVGAASGVERFELTFFNDMTDSCHLWWYGTDRGKEMAWSNGFINRRAYGRIQLSGDDPFGVVVRVQGVDFHCGKQMLREVSRKDPNAVVVLSGVFLSAVRYVTIWDPYYRSYRLVPTVEQERAMVILRVMSRDGIGQTILGTRRDGPGSK